MTLSRGLGAFDDGTAMAPGVGTTPLDVRKSLGALFSSTGVMPGAPVDTAMFRPQWKDHADLQGATIVSPESMADAILELMQQDEGTGVVYLLPATGGLMGLAILVLSLFAVVSVGHHPTTTTEPTPLAVAAPAQPAPMVSTAPAWRPPLPARVRAAEAKTTTVARKHKSHKSSKHGLHAQR